MAFGPAAGVGLGQAFSSIVPNMQAQQKFQLEKQKQALEMALLQQEIELRGSAEKRAAEKWGIEMPELKQKPLQEAFDVMTKLNPDWANVPQGVALAKQLNIPTPQAIDIQTPRAKIAEMQGQKGLPQGLEGAATKPFSMPSTEQMAQAAGVYPQTGIPINPDRQLKLATEQAGLTTANIRNRLLSEPGFLQKFLSQISQPPTQGAPTGGSPSAVPLPPLAQRQEGATYQTPNGPAVWKKGPSGQFNLVATGAASPLSMNKIPSPTPAQSGNLSDPNVLQRFGGATAIDMIGQLLGGGVKASDVMPPPGSAPQDKYEQAKSSTIGQMEARGVTPGQMQQRAAEQGALAKAGYDKAIIAMEQLYPGIEQEYNKQEAMIGKPEAIPSTLQQIMGKGLKYSGAADMAKAVKDRAVYSTLGSPYHVIPQASSFANLEGMAAIMPGVRGYQYLLGKFNEHQPNWGQGQSPLNTYSRLRTLRDTILPEAIKMASQPMVEPYVLPQQLQQPQ